MSGTGRRGGALLQGALDLANECSYGDERCGLVRQAWTRVNAAANKDICVAVPRA
ncbi:hypothetical protein ONA91_30680 [Micromonospora sp. DR5-3]|uniref:hypothetical protein n=1 Tax=unclassified Micromonospora TaxID=2617518 RepID=UPI00165274CD|nr:MULTISPECIES: hypothetical protein [unclassified Micromonospora]MCW3818816.1 hypothetical protein [Micromonospora sp. DR5-3]